MVWAKKDQLRFEYHRLWIDHSRPFQIADLKERGSPLQYVIAGNSLVEASCIDVPGYTKAGMGGEVVSGLQEWADSLQLDTARHLIVWIGINDLLKGNATSIRDDWFELMQTLDEVDSLSVLTVPTIDLKEDGFFVSNGVANIIITGHNHFLSQQAKTYGYQCVNADSIIAASGVKKHQDDGVHLSCEASQAISRHFINRIDREAFTLDSNSRED